MPTLAPEWSPPEVEDSWQPPEVGVSEEWTPPEASAPETPAQPLPETAWNSITRGFLGLATKPVQAIANTQQAAIDLAGQAPVIGPAWKKALERLPAPARMMAPVAKDIEDRRAEMSPVDPRNQWTAAIAGAVPTVMGLAATGVLAGAPAALGTAGLMGAQSGFETADEIGVTSPAGKLATAAGFGAAEAGIEALGGLGAKPVIGSALKRFVKTAALEAIEEPLTGVAQDLVTRLAATEDPSNKGFTATGYDLAQLDPRDPRYLQKRILEAGAGAAGGMFAGSLAALPVGEQGSADTPVRNDVPTQPLRTEVSEPLSQPADWQPPEVVSSPGPNPQPPTPSPTASVTPQVSPVTTPAAQAEAPAVPTADAGSSPAAGLFQFEYEGLDENGNDVRGMVHAGDQAAAIAAVRASGHYPTIITQSTSPSPESAPTATEANQGPGAASASEYQPTTTLKDSVDRFRAIGADDPFLYRVSPEKELDDLARTVIDEDSRGLQAVTDDLLTLDSNDLGLTDREHAALLGHAMWKWATQPASEAQTTNVRAIRDILKPVGSRGGQLLQVFDYIKRLDPEFRLDETLDAAETTRTEAIQTATGGMTEAEIEAEIARRVQEELAKVRTREAAGVAASPVVRTAGGEAATTAAANERAIQDRADDLLNKYAKSQSDTLSWSKRKAVIDPLRALMSRHIKQTVPDFVEQAMALGVDETSAASLNLVGIEETKRIAGIRTARSEEKKLLADETQAMSKVNALAKEFSDTPSTSRAAKTELSKLIALASKQEVPNLEAQLTALKMKPATARQLADLLNESRRRSAVVAAAKARQAELEKPQSQAEASVNRLAREFSDTPSDGSKAQSEIQKLIGEAINGESSMPDFVDRALGLGVKPGTAAQLQRLVTEARRRAAAVAHAKAGDRLVESLKPRAPRLKSSHVNRMVKAWMDATEAGISDRADFRAAFEQAFQVPKAIPSALAADLRAKAVKARTLPQGSSERLSLEKDIEDDLAIHSGVSTWELFKAGWYQNILSGAGFQVVNAVGSIQNMVTPIFQSIGDAAAGNPASFIALLKGARRGLPAAAAGFTNTVQTGRAYKGGEKYGDVSASELTARGWQSATPAQKAIYTGMAQGLTRRISRIGAGVDVFFNSMAREMGAQTAAARKLAAKGLRYGTQEYKAAFAKELGFDGTKWTDAMAKAAADLRDDGKPVTMREVKRRALETATRERDPALTEAAHRVADRVTYQQDPEGSGKIISKIIEGFQGIPVAGRLLLPFNKIVSNFFAENLDYGGAGLLRAAFGEPVTQRIARAQGRDVSQPVKYETQERRERAIKGVVGLSTGLAVVAAAMANADAPDDDDNAFMIYGAGPKGKNERDAWLEAGNKPFSIRVKGRVIPFTETIFAVPMAVAGTYMDAQRYGTLKNHPTAAARLMFGSLKSMEAVANFGPLSSVKKGIDMLQGRVSSTNSMVSMSGVKGAVPAAALLRDIEQIMDPKRVDDSTLAGAILGDIPGLSAYQDLKLNRFGEPADDVGLPGIRRIIGTTKQPEPVIKFMLKHDLTMPGAADVTRVAEDMTFPDNPALDMDRISKLHLTRHEDRLFKQESGRMLKEGIQRTMKEIEAGEATGRVYPSDAIQKRIQAIDHAAENIAKRKLMGR